LHGVDGFHVGGFNFLEMTKTLQQRSTRGFLGKPTFLFGRQKPQKAQQKSRRPANGGAGKKGVVSRAAGSRRSYCDNDMVGSYAQNGHEHYAAGHDKTPEYTPTERLGWAILERAIDDLAAFAKAGIITREGKCKRWPRVWRNRRGGQVLELLAIANVKDPATHEQTVHFFTNGTAQWLCDLLGCRLTAEEIFFTTLKNHAK
jgi:hypothetical protein